MIEDHLKMSPSRLKISTQTESDYICGVDLDGVSLSMIYQQYLCASSLLGYYAANVDITFVYIQLLRQYRFSQRLGRPWIQYSNQGFYRQDMFTILNVNSLRQH